MTKPDDAVGRARLLANMRRLLGHHEFTRDRIGQPGCPVRQNAADHCLTIEAAIAALTTDHALREGN